MSDPPEEATKRAPDDPEGDEDGGSDVPLGAIAVTGFLAAVILVLWIGMYALNLTRS